MSEEKELEIEIPLPRIIEGPIVLSDGTALVIGDKVVHESFGRGLIRRLMHSNDVGDLVFVKFESGVDKILGASFVKKTT
jgi:hypothetical protein